MGCIGTVLGVTIGCIMGPMTYVLASIAAQYIIEKSGIEEDE